MGFVALDTLEIAVPSTLTSEVQRIQVLPRGRRFLQSRIRCVCQADYLLSMQVDCVVALETRQLADEVAGNIW